MKKKILFSSLLTIVLCLSLIAGSTFALFTSESTVNVAITSGKVNVVATVDQASIEFGSTLGAMLDETSVEFSEADNIITLDKIVPGDYVNFDLVITNNSDVSVNYRTVITVDSDDGLWDGLVVTIDGVEYDGGTKYADWALLAPASADIVVPVSISLPEEAGNEYQAKTCSLSYRVEALQGNAEIVNPYTYENGVYYINSEEGMMLMSQIANSVSHGEGRPLEFALTADMDMSSYVWEPFGALFVNVDGQGHTVSNLNCGTDSWGRSGFAGYAGGIVFKNLTLENVTSVGSQAGIIAGAIEGATLTDIVIAGTNTVAYDVTKNPEETWGGAGAIAAMAQSVNAASNVTIASGATVTVSYNDLETLAPAQNKYSFISDISGIVTDNGTVSIDGSFMSLEEIDGVIYYTGEEGIFTLYEVPATYTDTTLTVPEGVEAIGAWAFVNNNVVEELILPSTIKTIGNRAFKANTSLKSIVIPEGADNIEEGAFQQSSVETVSVLGGSIGKQAFAYNSSLKTVLLGKDVTYVENYAFRGCADLTTVIILSENITFGGTSMAFSNAESGKSDNITIFVPNETVADAVKAANGSCTGYTVINTSDTSSSVKLEVVESTDVSDVRDAVSSGDAYVVITGDVTGSATSGGYSVAGLAPAAGSVLDGNGNTFTANGANGTWDCAIYTRGGTIKNLTVSGAFRGIFTAGQSADIIIDNVIFDNVTYTFNSDDGNKEYSVTIKNSVLNGWTSYSDVHKYVTFENCTFGEGNGYAFCRPYNATTFTNCVFEEGFAIDTTRASEIIFENCYYGDTLITAENAESLGLFSTIGNAQFK